MNVAGHYLSSPAMVFCGLVALGAAVAVGFFGFGVAPWFIVMGAFCVLMMGSMLWMMVGMGGHAGHRMGGHTRDRQRGDTEARAVEILERRFAEGTLSEEDYRARRKVLVGGRPETEGRAR